jgi:hypothetical protein
MLLKFSLRRNGRALCLWLCLVAVAPAFETAGAQPVDPANRYGIADDYGYPNSQTALSRAREAGIGWVYLVAFWNRLNPAPGVYDWSYLDQELAYIEGAGLNVYVRIAFPPAWTTGVSYPNDQVPYFCLDETQPLGVKNHPDCNNPARTPNLAAFDTFVGEIVTRYRTRVRAWGFGTEVHSRVFWQGTSEQFVRDFLKRGYDIVKSIDAGLTVVGPDEDIASSLAELLAFEGTYGRFADAISFHILRHSGGDLDRLRTQLKPVIDQYGAGRKVWLTELGMQVDNACLTETIQGEWLRLQLEGLLAPEFSWIERAFVFRLKDVGDFDDFGILSAYDDPKPAWFAVRGVTGAGVVPRSVYMAEGATGGFFDLDVAIANPTCQPAAVNVRFLRADGTTVVHPLVVNGKTRFSLRVDDVANMGATATSAVVESTSGVQLVAERTMFWDANYYGGHGGSAVAEPRTTWYFAEGSQGFFDTYVLLANSTASPATVTVTFLREGAGPVVRTYTVAAASRFNVYAGDDLELRNRSFSIAITSNVAIMAERAMYFGTARFWDAGHESAGVPDPSVTWYHAEGATGPYFDTYILVGNPNATQATVTFTFLLETGQTITRIKTIPALGRLTVNVESEDPLLGNAAVSTTVTSNVPVISERAMYWPGAFTSWNEAHNSFGVTETGIRWALAEGRVGGAQGFETYILVANPNPSPASVRITYLRASGNPIVKSFTVGPTSRFNVHVNSAVPELSGEHFGAIIEATNGTPIIVERAMYWSALGVVWAGGTNVTAVRLQ